MEEQKIYYTTSHNQTLAEFIETEVKDRENYTKKEIREWKKKYHLTNDTVLIWVALYKWRAFSYLLGAEEMEGAENLSENEMYDVEEIKTEDGYIIPESDDGDDGFIFIYHNQEHKNEDKEN